MRLVADLVAYQPQVFLVDLLFRAQRAGLQLSHCVILAGPGALERLEKTLDADRSKGARFYGVRVVKRVCAPVTDCTVALVPELPLQQWPSMPADATLEQRVAFADFVQVGMLSLNVPAEMVEEICGKLRQGPA